MTGMYNTAYDNLNYLIDPAYFRIDERGSRVYLLHEMIDVANRSVGEWCRLYPNVDSRAIADYYGVLRKSKPKKYFFRVANRWYYNKISKRISQILNGDYSVVNRYDNAGNDSDNADNAGNANDDPVADQTERILNAARLVLDLANKNDDDNDDDDSYYRHYAEHATKSNFNFDVNTIHYVFIIPSECAELYSSTLVDVSKKNEHLIVRKNNYPIIGHHENIFEKKFRSVRSSSLFNDNRNDDDRNEYDVTSRNFKRYGRRRRPIIPQNPMFNVCEEFLDKSTSTLNAGMLSVFQSRNVVCNGYVMAYENSSKRGISLFEKNDETSKRKRSDNDGNDDNNDDDNVETTSGNREAFDFFNENNVTFAFHHDVEYHTPVKLLRPTIAIIQQIQKIYTKLRSQDIDTIVYNQNGEFDIRIRNVVITNCPRYLNVFPQIRPYVRITKSTKYNVKWSPNTSIVYFEYQMEKRLQRYFKFFRRTQTLGGYCYSEQGLFVIDYLKPGLIRITLNGGALRFKRVFDEIVENIRRMYESAERENRRADDWNTGILNELVFASSLPITHRRLRQGEMKLMLCILRYRIINPHQLQYLRNLKLADIYTSYDREFLQYMLNNPNFEKCFKKRIDVENLLVCTYSRHAQIEPFRRNELRLPVCTSTTRSRVSKSHAYNFFKTTIRAEYSKYDIGNITPLYSLLRQTHVIESKLSTILLSEIITRLRLRYPRTLIAVFSWMPNKILYDNVANAHVNARTYDLRTPLLGPVTVDSNVVCDRAAYDSVLAVFAFRNDFNAINAIDDHGPYYECDERGDDDFEDNSKIETSNDDTVENLPNLRLTFPLFVPLTEEISKLQHVVSQTIIYNDVSTTPWDIVPPAILNDRVEERIFSKLAGRYLETRYLRSSRRRKRIDHENDDDDNDDKLSTIAGNFVDKPYSPSFVDNTASATPASSFNFDDTYQTYGTQKYIQREQYENLTKYTKDPRDKYAIAEHLDKIEAHLSPSTNIGTHVRMYVGNIYSKFFGLSFEMRREAGRAINVRVVSDSEGNFAYVFKTADVGKHDFGYSHRRHLERRDKSNDVSKNVCNEKLYDFYRRFGFATSDVVRTVDPDEKILCILGSIRSTSFCNAIVQNYVAKTQRTSDTDKSELPHRRIFCDSDDEDDSARETNNSSERSSSRDNAPPLLLVESDFEIAVIAYCLRYFDLSVAARALHYCRSWISDGDAIVDYLSDWIGFKYYRRGFHNQFRYIHERGVDLYDDDNLFLQFRLITLFEKIHEAPITKRVRNVSVIYDDEYLLDLKRVSYHKAMYARTYTFLANVYRRSLIVGDRLRADDVRAFVRRLGTNDRNVISYVYRIFEDKRKLNATLRAIYARAKFLFTNLISSNAIDVDGALGREPANIDDLFFTTTADAETRNVLSAIYAYSSNVVNVFHVMKDIIYISHPIVDHNVVRYADDKLIPYDEDNSTNDKLIRGGGGENGKNIVGNGKTVASRTIVDDFHNTVTHKISFDSMRLRRSGLENQYQLYRKIDKFDPSNVSSALTVYGTPVKEQYSNVVSKFVY